MDMLNLVGTEKNEIRRKHDMLNVLLYFSLSFVSRLESMIVSLNSERVEIQPVVIRSVIKVIVGILFSHRYQKICVAMTKYIIFAAVSWLKMLAIYGMEVFQEILNFKVLHRMRKLAQLVWALWKIFFSSNEDLLERMMRKYPAIESPPYRGTFASRNLVYVNRLSDIQIVLNNPSTLSKGRYYKFFKVGVGEGLFSAPVEKWKRHRRLISPIFNSQFLAYFMPIFCQKNRELVDKLKTVRDTDQSINLWDYIAPFNLDIVFETMMDCKAETVMTEKDTKEFQRSIILGSKLTNTRLCKPWLHPDFIFYIYGLLHGLSTSLTCMKKHSMQIIRHKKNILKQRQSGREDCPRKDVSDEYDHGGTFLDKLINLNEQGAEFSDQDLQDEVITMMIGGSETTALTNCFTLLMLAMHPDIQTKVYKEVIEVLGEEDRAIVMEDVRNLTFLEQCIKETLRLFPAGPFLLREVTDDIKLSGDVLVKRGDTIMFSPILVHRNPNVYQHPEVWNPDNFLPEEVNKRHRYSFLPFSGGPRGCIGLKYAMISMKLTISLILKNYYLTTDVKMNDIKLAIDLLLRSETGYHVKLHSR